VRDRRFQAERLPVHPHPKPRYGFVFSQISGAILRFLILDLTISYANFSLVTISDASIPVRLVFGGLMMVYARFSMDIPYRIISAISPSQCFSVSPHRTDGHLCSESGGTLTLCAASGRTRGTKASFGRRTTRGIPDQCCGPQQGVLLQSLG
jgi:hypothetical protein